MRLNNTKETVPFIVTALWFLLINVNVNQLLGLTYLAFTLLTMIIYKWDRIRTTPLDKDGKIIFPFFKGALIYAGFVVIASLLLPLFQKIQVGNLLQLIATTTPALAKSQILNNITFVIFVPFAETIFFVVLMDYLASKWNIDISKRGIFNMRTLALVFGLSFVFLALHITAKGITNNAALLLVFLMMVVTLIGAIYFGQSKEVIIFHMIANAFGLGLLGAVSGITGMLSLICFILL